MLADLRGELAVLKRELAAREQYEAWLAKRVVELEIGNARYQ